jgi:hypothetical protein
MRKSAKASYRLLPLIDIHGPIRAEHCRLLQSCFPPGVLQVADSVSDPNYKNVTVVNARRDTVSREVLRHPEFANCVKLGRRREHFICKSSTPIGTRLMPSRSRAGVDGSIRARIALLAGNQPGHAQNRRDARPRNQDIERHVMPMSTNAPLRESDDLCLSGHLDRHSFAYRSICSGPRH